MTLTLVLMFERHIRQIRGSEIVFHFWYLILLAASPLTNHPHTRSTRVSSYPGAHTAFRPPTIHSWRPPRPLTPHPLFKWGAYWWLADDLCATAGSLGETAALYVVYGERVAQVVGLNLRVREVVCWPYRAPYCALPGDGCDCAWWDYWGAAAWLGCAGIGRDGELGGKCIFTTKKLDMSH